MTPLDGFLDQLREMLERVKSIDEANRELHTPSDKILIDLVSSLLGPQVSVEQFHVEESDVSPECRLHPIELPVGKYDLIGFRFDPIEQPGHLLEEWWQDKLQVIERKPGYFWRRNATPDSTDFMTTVAQLLDPQNNAIQFTYILKSTDVSKCTTSLAKYIDSFGSLFNSTCASVTFTENYLSTVETRGNFVVKVKIMKQNAVNLLESTLLAHKKNAIIARIYKRVVEQGVLNPRNFMMHRIKSQCSKISARSLQDMQINYAAIEHLNRIDHGMTLSGSRMTLQEGWHLFNGYLQYEPNSADDITIHRTHAASKMWCDSFQDMLSNLIRLKLVVVSEILQQYAYDYSMRIPLAFDLKNIDYQLLFDQNDFYSRIERHPGPSFCIQPAECMIKPDNQGFKMHCINFKLSQCHDVQSVFNEWRNANLLSCAALWRPDLENISWKAGFLESEHSSSVYFCFASESLFDQFLNEENTALLQQVQCQMKPEIINSK